MISVVVASRNKQANDIHQAHISSTIGSDYEYISIPNYDAAVGLCEIYNGAIKQAKGDYIVFVHDDVFFVTPNWGVILEKKFCDEISIGCIGVAGTQYLFANDPFWVKAGPPLIHGKVIHENIAQNRLVLTVFGLDSADVDVVAVDGLFFAVRASIFKDIEFDSRIFSGFHFYDIDISMQIKKISRLVVTPDILVKHSSQNSFNNDWKKYKALFIEKYKLQFPVTCSNIKPDIAEESHFSTIALDSTMKPETLHYITSLGKTNTSHLNKHNDPIYIVTGMHRSGTSAITGLLNLCGFSIGKKHELLNANAPRPDNKKGHYEHITSVLINDKFLQAAGGAWNIVPSSDAMKQVLPLVEQNIRNLLTTFDAELIKDPRFCLTLKYWKNISDRIHTIIISFRNPVSVALSLHKRDGFDIKYGMELWYQYMIALIDNLDNLPAVLVDYDHLTKHSINDIYKLLQLLNRPISKEEIILRCKVFFDPSLNHHQSESLSNISVPDHINELYQILLKRAFHTTNVK